MNGDSDWLLVEKVWNKGFRIPWQDPRYWRQDIYGNTIYRYAYANRWSPYGWEIEHIVPQSMGGADELWNLRPLHFTANAARQPGSKGFAVL